MPKLGGKNAKGGKSSKTARVLSLLTDPSATQEGHHSAPEENTAAAIGAPSAQRLDDKSAQDEIRNALVQELFGRQNSDHAPKSTPKPPEPKPPESTAPFRPPVREDPAPASSVWDNDPPPVQEAAPASPPPVQETAPPSPSPVREAAPADTPIDAAPSVWDSLTSELEMPENDPHTPASTASVESMWDSLSSGTDTPAASTVGNGNTESMWDSLAAEMRTPAASTANASAPVDAASAWDAFLAGGTPEEERAPAQEPASQSAPAQMSAPQSAPAQVSAPQSTAPEVSASVAQDMGSHHIHSPVWETLSSDSRPVVRDAPAMEPLPAQPVRQEPPPQTPPPAPSAWQEPPSQTPPPAQPARQEPPPQTPPPVQSAWQEQPPQTPPPAPSAWQEPPSQTPPPAPSARQEQPPQTPPPVNPPSQSSEHAASSAWSHLVQTAPAPAQEPQAAPGSLHDPTKEDREGHFVCFNLTQALVEAKADKYMNLFGMCTCNRCKVDVTALALSNLPSKYVATQNTEILPLLSMYEKRYSAAVTAQVMTACKMVMARPHHGR